MSNKDLTGVKKNNHSKDSERPKDWEFDGEGHAEFTQRKISVVSATATPLGTDLPIPLIEQGISGSNDVSVNARTIRRSSESERKSYSVATLRRSKAGARQINQHKAHRSSKGCPNFYIMFHQCGEKIIDKMDRIIIQPSGTFYRIWEVIIVILLLYTLLVLPVRVAFEDQDASDKIIWLDYSIDILFGIDIILNFFTGYEQKSGLIETDPRKIIMHYLKGWFIVDLIAIIPWSNIGGAQLGKAADTSRMLKMWKLTRLLKVFRAYRFQEIIDSLYYSSPAPASVIRIISLFFVSMAFAHISACLWYFFANIDPHRSWVHGKIGNVNITDKSGPDLYMLSFYWALCTLTTVGYGDITPMNTAETWWCITNMLLGTTFFAYMAGSVTSIITASDMKKQQYRHHMVSLRRFISDKNLPVDLNNELTRHLKEKWQDQFRADVTWDEMRKWVDDNLQWRIIEEAYGDLIENSNYFDAINRELLHRNEVYKTFVVELASAFRGHEYLKDDEICKRDDKVLYWHIIVKGSVALEVPSKKENIPLARLDIKVSGDKETTMWDTFGECGLFFGDTWQVNVRATQTCDVYLVLLARLDELLQEPPNRCIYDAMLQLATKKYDQLKKKLAGIDKKRISTGELGHMNDDSDIDRLLQLRYGFIDEQLQTQSKALDEKLRKQFRALDIMMSRFEKHVYEKKSYTNSELYHEENTPQ